MDAARHHGTGEGGMQEGADDVNARLRPQRIPPPPLTEFEEQAMLRAIAARNNDNSAQQEFLLRIRCPSMTVVQVQVHVNMTADLLARCASQAIASTSPQSPASPSDALVGLFGEKDGLFHSFEDILLGSQRIPQIYALAKRVPKIEKKDDSWTFLDILMGFVWLLVAGVLAGAIVFRELVWEYVTDYSMRMFNFVFDLPFRELYRYGPHIIGWEGMDLPEVCSRITYHGNRDFWARNMEECEFIYGGKEEAFLSICRPIAYTLFALTSFWAIRHLVATYAESKRDRTDRAVYDTYRAVQTLVRVINQQLNGKKR